MDPFSITVGIASLVNLTAHTIRLTNGYIREARHSREAAADLSKELDVLHFNLSRLDEFLRKNEVVQPFDNTSVLVSSTSACRNKLTILRDKLEGVGGTRLSRLKWPLNSKEHQESIQELRAFVQWIQFALTVDGCALLAKTSAEVLESLKNQLDTFQLVTSIGERTHLIERSLEEQTRLFKSSRAAEGREQILEWISAVKHEQKHHDMRRPRVDGTGEWLLQERIFQDWRDGPKSRHNVLWCQGIQGSGKSVITSLVIDRIRDMFLDQNVVIAHFYFDYRDQESQTADKVIASLLKQLTIAKAEVPQPVSELYQRLKGHQRQPQTQDLEQAFLHTCMAFERVFVVIDALDECDAINHRKPFLEFLDRLHSESSSNIFLTSRPHLEDAKNIYEISSKITIQADDSDLRRYVSKEIERSDAVDDIDEKFKDDIIESVVLGAHKMFLLAVLQVQAILSETSAGEMEDALEAMPRGLDDAFEDTLQRIQKQPEKRKNLGMKTLMWISHARRPLKAAELSEALAVSPRQTFLNPKYQKSRKLMVACCLGLVTFDEKSTFIRLVHYSVQEYFREHHSRVFPFGEQIIALTSITYLLSNSFAPGPRQKELDILAIIDSHAFARYATRNWGHHVRDARSNEVDAFALKLLRSKPHRACCFQISEHVAGRREEYWLAEEAESRNGLHLAAVFGLEELANALLGSGECDVNSTTLMGSTALILAAANGHRSFLRMLFSKNADLTKENWYGTALHCAAESGTLVGISELLSTGLDVDIRDATGRTPLICATASRHLLAMQLLLQRGAQVDAISNQHYTSLRYAVMWEHPSEVVLTLLENGANKEIRSGSGLTVLHHAAIMNLEEVLRLLLDHGAEIDATQQRGANALHFAVEKNHFSIVQILLRRGANVDAQTQDGTTPLHKAAEHGADKIVRMLLKQGAQVDTANEEGLTPLHLATKENYKNIVCVLLAAGGADVNARSKDGRTALDIAFEHKSDRVAQVLLEMGAKRKAGPQQYWLVEERGPSSHGQSSPKNLDDESRTTHVCTECSREFKRLIDFS
ncbi:MAG: hypothetical protein Q9164_002040 [Protoblastenia rupestris]